MSFYINNNNCNRPGNICGNPLQGLCEKVMIEVTKVFDACVQRFTEQGVVLTATDFTPADPALPLTFISAESDPTNPATLSNVVITRLENRPNYAQVTGTLTIPVVITYRDANGVLGTAQSTITRTVSTILFVPQPSTTPIQISAIGVVSSTIGTFTAPDTFIITLCLEIIIKVVANVDILVPSYGYPQIPECQPPQEAQCPGFFDMPMYPTAITNTNVNPNNR